MNKKIFIISYVLFCSLTHQPTLSAKHNNTIIESAILHAADGIFFTKDDVGILLQLREYLRKLLYGTKDQTGQITGPVFLNGHPYCLRTLYDVEKTLTPKVRDTWLRTVITEFKKQTEKSKKRAEKTRVQQLQYILESCHLHHRPEQDNILVMWAKSPEGKEDEVLDMHVHNFADMAQFVIDLMNFLDDMVSSCPKAREQFIASIPNKEERKTITTLLNHIFEQQKVKIQKNKLIYT